MRILASLPIGALLIVLQMTYALAGRPLVVDDAAPVAPGQLEIEFGLFHAPPHGGGREQAWPAMTLAYGLIQRLEAVDHRCGGFIQRRQIESRHVARSAVALIRPRLLG